MGEGEPKPERMIDHYQYYTPATSTQQKMADLITMKNHHNLFYLASPYTHEESFVMQKRFEQACRATTKLFEVGFLVYSAIAHSHPIAQYGLPRDWTFWENYDKCLLQRSEAMLVLCLPAWDQSVGIAGEMKIMKLMNKPIYFVEPDEWVLRSDDGCRDIPLRIRATEIELRSSPSVAG